MTQAWTGEKPQMQGLRIFGCQAFAHIPKDERKKLDSKSRKSVFMGYGETTKGYRLYDQTKKKVFFSRDVIFNEQKCGFEQSSEVEPQKRVYLEYSEEDTETTSVPETADTSEPVPRRSDRERRQPNYYGRCIVADVKEPSSVRNAMENQEWLDAMQTEIDSVETG